MSLACSTQKSFEFYTDKPTKNVTEKNILRAEYHLPIITKGNAGFH